MSVDERVRSLITWVSFSSEVKGGHFANLDTPTH